MKRTKLLLLLGMSLTFLTGCGDDAVKSIEIESLPKTTFYCGEEFSNTGISVRVNLSNGKSFVTEDVATSKPATNLPGSQKVKVYYTNDNYNFDDYVTYDINVIDWTKEEKAIFSETSISTFAGVYYPKMEGMHLLLETDDDTGEILDYWIQKENATFKDIDAYTELLNNYFVTKPMRDENGNYDMMFKFYEQSTVPSDFRDLYDINDAICYKYCASYKYLDPTYFEEYELYGNEIEDTLVIGLDDNGNMIVRFIANSIYLETMLSFEVNERLDFNSLFTGATLEYLNQVMLGYVDEEGVRYLGYIESIAPFAKEHFFIPTYEPDVIAISNYASMYPWLHGEDDACFEVEVVSNDKDEYEDFIKEIEKDTAFVKTTKQDNVKNHDVNVNVYTIENLDYVGNLVIEVTDFIENGSSYYQSEGSTRVRVDAGCYRIYYRFQAPDIISPCEYEIFKIYDIYYGEGNYDSTDYDIYEDGEIGGLVKYAKSDEMNSKEAALRQFVADYLNGYSVVEGPEEKDVSGFTVYAATYTNSEFDIDIYAYYDGAKYSVEFSIGIAK